MIRLIRILLFPISILYAVAMWLRNRLYDHDMIKSTAFGFPVVVIGNLAVGGTGKSPMAEYILRLISPKKDIALLSRGYGRKTKGFREVSIKDTADLVGDEPLQIKRKFSQVQVYVCEDRVQALRKISGGTPGVLLDDAYQHRPLRPSFSVLLFDYKSLLSPIVPLPTGNFRDRLIESKRAGVIVVTKCPNNLSQETRFTIQSRLRKHSSAPIYFSTIDYEHLKNKDQQTITPTALANYHVILFTGIANPKPLLDYLKPNSLELTHINFNDHHAFSSTDIQVISDAFHTVSNESKIIVTTEKDYQRLPSSFAQTYPIYIVPIHQKILFGEQDAFDSIIKRAFQVVN